MVGSRTFQGLTSVRVMCRNVATVSRLFLRTLNRTAERRGKKEKRKETQFIWLPFAIWEFFSFFFV